MGNVISTFTNDVLGNMDATAIAQSIAKKEISVQEVTEAAIARAEKANPALNAIVLRMYDDARKFGGVAKGGLYGVPTFIKDSDNVAGYPTQLGTGAFKAKTAKRNSKFVGQFLSTGLNALGKTTMPEFGLICSTENERWGITRNPWDTDYTTGGSSSGSAAMVASGAVPIALANDGAGSIRIPAAICGLVGLKPTRNRLYGMDGAELMPLQLIHQGVLTRSVRDTALFYAEAEKHHANAKLPKLGYIDGPNKQRLRIAFYNNMAPGKVGHQDADTYSVQLETAKLLESLGHTVEQITLPIDADVMANYFLHYYGFLSYMLSYWSRFTLKSNVDRTVLEPFTTGLADRFRTSKAKLFESIGIMRKMGAAAEKDLEKYDLIMTPTLAHKTPKIGHFSPLLTSEEVTKRAVHFASYTGLNNVTGSPAISLPLGTDRDGMPLGVHFIAPYGNDRRLIELAYELEQAKPWVTLYNAANTKQVAAV